MSVIASCPMYRGLATTPLSPLLSRAESFIHMYTRKQICATDNSRTIDWEMQGVRDSLGPIVEFF